MINTQIDTQIDTQTHVDNIKSISDSAKLNEALIFGTYKDNNNNKFLIPYSQLSEVFSEYLKDTEYELNTSELENCLSKMQKLNKNSIIEFLRLSSKFHESNKKNPALAFYRFIRYFYDSNDLHELLSTDPEIDLIRLYSAFIQFHNLIAHDNIVLYQLLNIVDYKLFSKQYYETFGLEYPHHSKPAYRITNTGETVFEMFDVTNIHITPSAILLVLIGDQLKPIYNISIKEFYYQDINGQEGFYKLAKKVKEILAKSNGKTYEFLLATPMLCLDGKLITEFETLQNNNLKEDDTRLQNIINEQNEKIKAQAKKISELTSRLEQVNQQLKRIHSMSEIFNCQISI